MRVLSGDIGATKTRLAIIEVIGTALTVKHERSYPSPAYENFAAVLDEFLHGIAVPRHAAFGIAGPIQGRTVQTTNLPWHIDADALQKQFNLSRCTFLNDLEAMAYGLPALNPEDFYTLQTGVSHAIGNMAIVAVGTGLGEAGLYWDGARHRPFATEGGHASFSPGSELEMALLTHLQKEHEHVSWERVVSGIGLRNLHDFLRYYHKVPAPDWLAAEISAGDAGAAISSAAISGRDEICREALGMFLRLYGAEASNFALKIMSKGGVLLGGGIAPKILPELDNGIFLKAFLNKGRMRPLLAAMPVRVILNDRAGLLGPALLAAQTASD